MNQEERRKKRKEKNMSDKISISRKTAAQMIGRSKGKYINYKFVKKDGTDRSLTGRTGVYNSKHSPLTGVGMSYNPKDYGLVGVFDTHKKAYRMVNLNTLYELSLNGNQYEIMGE